MRWYVGLPFAVAIAFATAYLSKTIELNVTALMIMATSFWVSSDSKKIGLIKYKSGISYPPHILFILCLLLWIAALPWYLHVRHKIVNNLAELKSMTAEISA